MPLTKVTLTNFTAFDHLAVDFSPGINVLVGANGTGKTHLLKACYAICDAAKTRAPIIPKLVKVFMPSGRDLGRLVKGQKGGAQGKVELFRENPGGWAACSIKAGAPEPAVLEYSRDWGDPPLQSVYIPVKEMLANAPGFLSLYAAREVHFEEIYADILHRAYLPPLRIQPDDGRKSLLTALEKVMGGSVSIKGEEFFLAGKKGSLEFSLLAEGIRKLALLWLLIRNGSLSKGSVLFWDEPEANLNPQRYGILIQTLLELQRAGVQIFLATHDYVILKELDLRLMDGDQVAYHSLYRDEVGEIAGHTTGHHLGIHPNAIMDTFTDLYDREVERSLSGTLSGMRRL